MLIDVHVHMGIISIEIDRFVRLVIILVYHALILLLVNIVQVIIIIEFSHTTVTTIINNLIVYVYQAITTMQQIQSAYNAIQIVKLAKIPQQTV